MGIFNNEIIINEENPFENDKLNRECEADNLTNLFSLVENQMVLAIDSPWGTGKSSFLKMWNQKLRNNGYDTVFFNAWENDFVDDAFIAFVQEIREGLSHRPVDNLIENAKLLAGMIVKNSPKMLANFIEKKSGINVTDMVSIEDISNLIGDKINEYKNTKDSIKKFKDELENIAKEIVNVTGKPIIIFVDELDRCRPDFAIRLLERIKHLFSVKNIIFILGIDKQALSNSVKVVYGESTQVNGYLAKFIDMEYKLNDLSSKQYIGYLLEKLKFDEIFSRREKFNRNILETEYSYSDFLNVLESLFIGFKLSLREIEKIISEIYFILRSNESKFIYPYPLILLCIIKRLDKETYNKIKSKQIKFKGLVDILSIKFNWFKHWVEDYDNAIFKANILWLLDDKEEIVELKNVVSNIKNEGVFDNPINRCLELYEWINKGEAYFGAWRNGEFVRNLLFSRIDFYETISI
ncbi:hypothetical protein SDC9_107247 [bioreactor metagenome]|uniref:KAP NTPase domain-containing protein n=1 Tax=bioreactor metagenome TaxID=1076179 RepID=A0A645B5R5_9ZZZZ